jgi:hypothetical protein
MFTPMGNVYRILDGKLKGRQSEKFGCQLNGNGNIYNYIYNYTDRAIFAVGLIKPIFEGRRCCVVSATDPHGR